MNLGKKHPVKNDRLLSHQESRQGFTLLEVIVAIVILAAAMSIAAEVFTATLQGWKRGTEVAEGIKHGDFAMNQLVAALDSTVYFYNPRKVYAFRVEKDSTQGLPSDIISFVTANSAFMPPYSPYAHGSHRLKVFVDLDDKGKPALFALPMPAIADPDEFEDEYAAEPLLVSRSISGLEIQFWDKDSEIWSEEWEPENSIPERIKIDLYISSLDEDEEPILFSRVIEIPVSKSVNLRLTGPTTSGEKKR